eukprot:jgi/Ulvmu1/8848/UM049_0030.1
MHVRSCNVGTLQSSSRVQVPRGARIVLLTTFDANTRIIAHQETSVDDAVRQARVLRVPLLGVPLPRGGDAADAATGGYIETVRRALLHIRRTFSCNAQHSMQQHSTAQHSTAQQGGGCAEAGGKVIGLAFGDLHLEHVRLWREAANMQGEGEELLFPLWRRDCEDMMRELESCGVPCVVSAVAEEGEGVVEEGERFGPALRERALAAGIDGFGENGEFHTLACVWDAEGAAA